MNLKVLFAGLALVCVVQAAPRGFDNLDEVVVMVTSARNNVLKIQDRYEEKIFGAISSWDVRFGEELVRINRQIQESVVAAEALGVDVKSCIKHSQLNSLYEEAVNDASKCYADGKSALKKVQDVLQDLIVALDSLLDKAQAAAVECSKDINIVDCRNLVAIDVYFELAQVDQTSMAKLMEATKSMNDAKIKMNSCVERTWLIFADRTGEYLKNTLKCIKDKVPKHH